MRITLPLEQLCKPNDPDLLKIILSSADRFPGLYRISSSFKETLNSDLYMKWIHFFEVTYKTTKNNQKWKRTDWLKAQDSVFDIGFGANSRNEERSEDDLKLILKNKYYHWYNSSNTFCLAVIDNQNPVEQIEVDTTYYMMGSMIRFTEKSVHIGWDQVTQTAYQTIEANFNDTKKFIESIYSHQAIEDLFFKSEIVGHLFFDEKNLGHLKFNETFIESHFHLFNPKSIVLAANLYEKKLPIQFAKPIGVSNVCR